MAAKPRTTEAIALTEKKMDMSLDDIIKMSESNTSKAMKQRVSNRSQKFLNNSALAQENSTKVQRFMDSRSSVRQGVLAQRRSNFQGNQFLMAAEAARKAAVAPIHNGAFNRGREFNMKKPRKILQYSPAESIVASTGEVDLYLMASLEVVQEWISCILDCWGEVTHGFPRSCCCRKVYFYRF